MVKISFIGDISFNDKYIDLYKKGINPFENISNNLSKSDFVIGNLESIAEGNNGENLLKKPRLKTKIETLNYLETLNVNLLTLAHNHVYDNLLDGFNKTIKYLEKKDINYIGAGSTIESSKLSFSIDINNLKFRFLNYVSRDTNPNLPKDTKVFLNWFNADKVAKDISKFRNEADYIVLLLHWGGRLEHGYYPDYDQIDIAHKLIDTGADLIVGGHSHTLQPYEVYKGKYIFYSLGNFCFADVHCEGKIHEIERGRKTESIIIEINFKKYNYAVNIFPISNNDMYIVENEFILRKLTKRNKTFRLLRKYKLLWQIYFFKYTYIQPVIFFLWGNDHNFFQQINKLSPKKILRFIRK